jgi:hypothetical protein
MEYPKYLVNISYYPSRPAGQQIVYLNGITQSMHTYDAGYYLASMPELKIAASGSNYTTALNNLLAVATASATVDGGNGPFNSIRNW